MLARTILTGGRQADQVREVDGRLEAVEPTATVQGSGQESDAGSISVRSCEHLGHTTVMSATPYDLVVRRVLDVDEPADAGLTLTGLNLQGTWKGQETPALLAFTRNG